METLRKLTEEFRVFDLDKDEEVDLLDVLSSLIDDEDGVEDTLSSYFNNYGDEEDISYGTPPEELPPPESYETEYSAMDSQTDDLAGFSDYNFDSGNKFNSSNYDQQEEPESEDSDDISDEESDEYSDEETEMGDKDQNANDKQNDAADFQGAIRTIRGACLVYKRQQEDGTFEELWIYNIGKKYQREEKIKKGIIAGTDIDISKLQSQDGSQKIKISSIGNVQFLTITGLPN